MIVNTVVWGGIQQLTCLKDVRKFEPSDSSIKHRTSWVNNIPFKPYQTYCMVNEMSSRITLENSLVLREKKMGKDFCLPCEDRIIKNRVHKNQLKFKLCYNKVFSVNSS